MWQQQLLQCELPWRLNWIRLQQLLLSLLVFAFLSFSFVEQNLIQMQTMQVVWDEQEVRRLALNTVFRVYR